MESPSKNSPTLEKEDTPRSSPPQPTTTSSAETVPASPSRNASPAVGGAASEGGRGLMGASVRIPWQVMELTSGGDSGGEGRSSVTMAAAVPVVGGLVEKAMEKPGVGEESGSSSSKGKQKRKGSELRDPPSGNPICPECGREFASWKSVFGHLRIHSRRSYTGLFPPPVSPPRQPPQGDEASEVRASGEEEGSSATNKVLGLDLNKPSDAEASSQVEKNDEEEEHGNAKFGFDLNQPPADEEDEDDIEGRKQP